MSGVRIEAVRAVEIVPGDMLYAPYGEPGWDPAEFFIVVARLHSGPVMLHEGIPGIECWVLSDDGRLTMKSSNSELAWCVYRLQDDT